jgi:hypothetical protein
MLVASMHTTTRTARSPRWFSGAPFMMCTNPPRTDSARDITCGAPQPKSASCPGKLSQQLSGAPSPASCPFAAGGCPCRPARDSRSQTAPGRHPSWRGPRRCQSLQGDIPRRTGDAQRDQRVAEVAGRERRLQNSASSDVDREAETCDGVRGKPPCDARALPHEGAGPWRWETPRWRLVSTTVVAGELYGSTVTDSGEGRPCLDEVERADAVHGGMVAGHS